MDHVNIIARRKEPKTHFDAAPKTHAWSRLITLETGMPRTWKIHGHVMTPSDEKAMPMIRIDDPKLSR